MSKHSVHMTMDSKALKRLDRIANSKGLTRSAFIRMAILERMKEEEGS